MNDEDERTQIWLMHPSFSNSELPYVKTHRLDAGCLQIAQIIVQNS